MNDYMKRMHFNAVRMFKEIGIKNGILMLSGFYENGEFYLYDTGFRLQGEAPHLLLNFIYGYDQREMLVRFALTGNEGEKVDLYKEDPYMSGKWSATVWFLLKEGKIARVEGFDDVANDKRVVNNVVRLRVGDEVLKEWIGTEKQVLTRLYLVCDTKEELASAIKEYQQKCKVYNENGENMLLKGFDVDKALEL